MALTQRQQMRIRANKNRALAKRKLAVRKYERWALKYTPARPVADGLTAVGHQRVRRKLLFGSIVAINPAAGVCGVHTFRANDLYDPNLTGAGHQPRGFDQLMTLYNKFKVHASKITVQMHANGSTGLLLALESGPLAGAGAPPPSQVIERQRTSWQMVSSTINLGSLVNDFNLKRDMKVESQDVVLNGTVSASPTKIWNYNIWMGPGDESADLSTQYATVIIEYDAEFFEPKVVGSS